MHRTVVNAGVDEDLDKMKQTYDGIEDLLGHTSREIAATIPREYDVDLNVIFFPQIGFLISVPVSPETGRSQYEGGVGGNTDWDLVFSTGVSVYYKDFRMRELDHELGDMYAIICGRFFPVHLVMDVFSTFHAFTDKEIEIVHELGQDVLRYEDMLNSASEICGELDRYGSFLRRYSTYALND